MRQQADGSATLFLFCFFLLAADKNQKDIYFKEINKLLDRTSLQVQKNHVHCDKNQTWGFNLKLADRVESRRLQRRRSLAAAF